MKTLLSLVLSRSGENRLCSICSFGWYFAGLVMLYSLPKFEESGQFSVSLPNWYNWSFHFPTFLQIYMLLFLPGMLLTQWRGEGGG